MFNNLEEKAKLLRKLCLVSTTEAGSGHPTSCLSAVDISTVLFENYFTYDVKNPKNPQNDRLIFSKGHAAPLFYSLFAMASAFPLEDLKNLRKFNSSLEGHSTLNFPFTEAATGSLGQGLSVSAGIALTAKKDNYPFKTYVLLGDGEMAEGSNWEAANFASYYKLNNLITIVDVNRLGQSQETMFGHDIEEYINRFSAFDWEVISIDGHNFSEIEKALKLATDSKSSKPFVIIAKTLKGKGISFLENKDNWHGKPLSREDLGKALLELGKIDETLRFKPKVPKKSFSKNQTGKEQNIKFDYKVGEEIATREIYGKVLAEMGKSDSSIYVLDGDTKNSTFSIDFQKVFPERFIECFIAEQNMVGVALGLSTREKTPFVSTFAAFLTRTFDQIRMAAISKGNIKFMGSHAGVSIGEDGPSQMGLEDIAMFGVTPDSVIFHPSDALSASKILTILSKHKGISYIRALRPKTPVIYSLNEEFKIGGSKVLRQSKDDLLTIVSCGLTVHESLKAYEILKKEGIFVRIVDCYSIKPIDKETLTKSLEETKKKIIITVEDHYEHGGLGDFVLSAVSQSPSHVEKMAVCKISRSGKREELLKYACIDSESIVKKVKELI